MLVNRKKIKGIIILTALLGLFSCASNKRSEPVAVKDDYALEVNGDSDSGTAGLLRSVFFDFDSSYVRGDTMATLDANIKYLDEHHEIEIEVEGHCDERGSAQYNLALGERRAKAIFDYMSANGVDTKRINIVTYGKEKPVAFGHSEDAWSQNRRANFVIKKLR